VSSISLHTIRLRPRVLAPKHEARGLSPSHLLCRARFYLFPPLGGSGSLTSASSSRPSCPRLVQLIAQARSFHALLVVRLLLGEQADISLQVSKLTWRAFGTSQAGVNAGAVSVSRSDASVSRCPPYVRSKNSRHFRARLARGVRAISHLPLPLSVCRIVAVVTISRWT
jgi:hypothetical protein